MIGDDSGTQGVSNPLSRPYDPIYPAGVGEDPAPTWQAHTLPDGDPDDRH